MTDSTTAALRDSLLASVPCDCVCDELVERAEHLEIARALIEELHDAFFHDARMDLCASLIERLRYSTDPEYVECAYGPEEGAS